MTSLLEETAIASDTVITTDQQVIHAPIVVELPKDIGPTTAEITANDRQHSIQDYYSKWRDYVTFTIDPSTTQEYLWPSEVSWNWIAKYIGDALAAPWSTTGTVPYRNMYGAKWDYVEFKTTFFSIAQQQGCCAVVTAPFEMRAAETAGWYNFLANLCPSVAPLNSIQTASQLSPQYVLYGANTEVISRVPWCSRYSFTTNEMEYRVHGTWAVFPIIPITVVEGAINTIQVRVQVRVVGMKLEGHQFLSSVPSFGTYGSIRPT